MYDKYNKILYRIAWKYCFDKDQALDLVQDVFIKVYKSIDKYQGDASFRTWLSRVATNHCIDHIRKKSNQMHPVSLSQDGLRDEILTGMFVAAGQDPSDEQQLEEFKTRLAEAMSGLSEKHREVFSLYAIREFSYKEIADQIGCSVGTVMSRLFYARKHLQDALSDLAGTQGNSKQSDE